MANWNNKINASSMIMAYTSDVAELKPNRGFIPLDASGEVVVETFDGSTSTLYATQGTFMPVGVQKIMSTGTVATQFAIVDGSELSLLELLDLREDIDWSNSRTGSRKSIIQGQPDSAENSLDFWTSEAGEEIYGCMDGYTNIIAADGLDYDKFESGTAAVVQASDNIRVVHAVDGDRGFAVDLTVDVEVGKAYTVSTYLSENTLDISRPVISVENNGSKVVTAGQTGIISYTFTAVATETIYVRFGQGADGAAGVGAVTFTEIRMAQATSRYPAQTDGSAAGKTVATDNISASPVWGASGTLFSVNAPYGWSGANNPASADARMAFAGDMQLFNPGDVRFFINPTTIDTNGSVVDNVVSVMSGDWNSSSIGARYNDTARASEVETNIPSGTLYLGNNSGASRPFHGACAMWYFPFVITDYQYALLRAYTIAQFGNVGSLFQ